MNNKTVLDEEKVTCYVTENGDIFCGDIEVQRCVVDFIHFGSTIQNLRGKTSILFLKKPT